MKQITVTNYTRKTNLSSVNMVRRETKNLLPANAMTGSDLMGLSWIFMEDDFATC